MTSLFARQAASACVLVVSLFGCTGNVGEMGPDTPAAGPGTEGTIPRQPPGKPAAPPEAPPPNEGATIKPATFDPTAAVMRRLTQSEYDNTLRDLLGDTTSPGAQLPPDEELLGFDTNAQALTFSSARAEAYLTAAEGVATRALAQLGTLLPCSKTPSPACAQTFIKDFGKRAFRRPLTAAEIAVLQKVHQTGEMLGGFSNGINLTLRSMLMSVPFLYVVEVGTPAADGRSALLNSWEMASRLSYTLWGTMPDGPLFTAAEADQLKTPEQIAAQVTRMLDDARARSMARRFFSGWLQLHQLDDMQKSTAAFPKYQTWLPDAYRQEVLGFLEDATFSPGVAGWQKALYTGNWSFMNAKLAAFYGVNGPSGTAFERVAVDGTRRGGLLTLGALMAMVAHANQTAPTLRGQFVRERLLCLTTPPPPPGTNNNIPEPSPTASTRERLTEHAVNPACANCHRLMDNIGFALENYDGVGLWRDKDGGKTIDASGEAPGTDIQGSFVGGIELGKRLAESQLARECWARHWFRFTMGRIEHASDMATVDALGAALARPGASALTLLTTLTGSATFRTRPLASIGGTP